MTLHLLNTLWPRNLCCWPMLGSSMQIFSLVIPFFRVLIVVRHAAVVSMLPTKCGRLGCSFSLAELCSTRSVQNQLSSIPGGTTIRQHDVGYVLGVWTRDWILLSSGVMKRYPWAVSSWKARSGKVSTYSSRFVSRSIKPFLICSCLSFKFYSSFWFPTSPFA